VEPLRFKKRPEFAQVFFVMPTSKCSEAASEGRKIAISSTLPLYPNPFGPFLTQQQLNKQGTAKK
jgi:hypothetical protein